MPGAMTAPGMQNFSVRRNVVVAARTLKPRRRVVNMVPKSNALRGVSEWLAATLEMSCRETGCEFESRALRFYSWSMFVGRSGRSDQIFLAAGSVRCRYFHGKAGSTSTRRLFFVAYLLFGVTFPSHGTRVAEEFVASARGTVYTRRAGSFVPPTDRSRPPVFPPVGRSSAIPPHGTSRHVALRPERFAP